MSATVTNPRPNFSRTFTRITGGPGRTHSLPPGEYILVPVEKDKCLPKVREDEPIFVLRGQDQTAVDTIGEWYRKNEHTLSSAKKQEVLDDIQKFYKYQRENPTLMKMPD